jgi:2-iminobutanoate/2-iminopropanoate deaminase
MVKRITTQFSYSSAVEAGDYVFIGLHRGFGERFAQQIHNTFTHLNETLQKCDTTEFIDSDCLIMIDGIAYKPSSDENIPLY